MQRFNRYLAANVLGATLAVLAVLVGLDALSSVIDEVDDLSADYGFLDVLVYVGFSLPRRIHEYIPFAALIGGLVGLGRMASASELTVAQTAGRSLLQLAAATLQPALLVAIAGFLIGEFVSPVSERMAVSHKALAQGAESSFTGQGGVWNRDGSTFIHVSAVQRGGVIHGVQLLTFDEQRRLTHSLRAERGTFMGDHWLLEKVQRTELTPEQASIDSVTTQTWYTEVTPQLLALEVVALDSLPTRQLWPYARYLKNQGLIYRDVELAFWRKMFQPIAVAGLVLVAMSFIFGPLRDGNLGARIFAGVIVGVVFRISQDFFGPASLIFGLPAILAALVPIGLCWIAGFWLLSRRP